MRAMTLSYRSKTAKPCAWCREDFFPYLGRDAEQTYCSKPCHHEARMANNRGIHEPPPAIDGCVWLDLGDGNFALIDEADAPVLIMHQWHRGHSGYALTRIDGAVEKTAVHQFLMPGVLVDHRNRDRLDNRRSNLRPATVAQNSANKSRYSNNTSGYKGVTESESGGKPRWVARAGIHGKRVYLGFFKSAEEAARAYDKAMLDAYGEFAALNFPEES